MNTDLKLIKRKYGEKMAHFCCKHFSTLLETKGLLPNILLNNFEPNHSLYDDIINQNKENKFKDCIYNLLKIKEAKEINTHKTPEELLNEAGYNLYECHTQEDIQSFKKYYAKGEELCTFNETRLKWCYVFFAVKKDVDQIKRKDYKTPNRQDKYGTSVISIQFDKDDSCALSIKNRYNHIVDNPDSTFSNNLDNIIPGLTKSFEDYYKMKQKTIPTYFEMINYVKANDGKYYKYNQNINNIYYCPNNIIIDNYEVKRYDKEKYIVMDYFILDLVNKKIKTYNNKINDSFIDTIKDIEKIEVKKVEKDKIVIIKVKNGIDVKIVLNEYNQIIKLENYNVKKVNNSFLYYNNTLQELTLPSLQVVGNDFLHRNNSLQVLSLPNLRIVGNDFLHYNKLLQGLNLPNLQAIGNCFLFYNKSLQVLNLPNLQIVRNDFLYYNNSLQFIYLPNIQKIGKNFLMSHPILNIDNFKDYETDENTKKLIRR